MVQAKEKTRIAWIDIVRGIGIFLVILGHTYRSNQVLNWIVSFHMPLFFILSGWLRGCNRKPFEWKTFILKKIQAFLVPLAIFQSVTYLYWLVIESRFREFDFGPMWFLIALFVAEVVSELIVDFSGFLGAAIAAVVSVVGLYLTSMIVEPATLLAWFPRCMGATLFFLIGVLVSKFIPVSKVTLDNKSRILVPIMAVGGVLLSQINGRVDLYFLLFGNYFIYIMAALVGSAFIYCLAMQIRENRFLEHIGRYSIIILCTHEPIKRAVIQVLSIVSRVPGETLRNNILIGFTIAVAVLLIELIVIQIVKYVADILRKTKFECLVVFVK